MRTRSLLVTAAALALCAGLSSCSDDEPDFQGTTPPLPGGESSAAPPQAGLPHSGAPAVAEPIADTAAWEADPCTMISADQLKAAGLTKAVTPKRQDSATGVGCTWEFDPDTVSIFSASIGTKGGRQGLSNVYQLNEQGSLEQFEVVPPIEGLPAAIASPKDETADGFCSVAVGLRDDLVFGVDMAADPSIEQGKDPCGWAVKLATSAVQTMKGSA